MASMEPEKVLDEDFIPEKPDYEAELISIIKSDAPVYEIREKLDDYHENDIADILDDLTEAERKKLLDVLGIERASEVFAYIDEDVGKYIEEIPPEDAADILESMDADEALEILEELGEEKRQELHELLDEESKRDIDMIDSYDDDEIGSKMTTNFVVIPQDMTIRQAMKSLVMQAADNDNIMTLYVLDKEEKFYGAIDLKDLIVAREFVKLDDLIQTSYPYVYDHESVDECLEELKDYSEDSIPVLDNEKHILGVITSQDIIEVVDEEMGEDYARLAGLTSEEDLNEPLLKSMKKRLPWLITLLVLGIIVSSVVGVFEGVIAELTIIVAFQTLILDMAGNVGTQSLAVTIRVLVDETLEIKQKVGLVVKEMRIGFVNGLILGSATFAGTGLFIWLARGYEAPYAFAISACIGVALLVAMVIASLVGTAVPLFFHRIKVDPAVASGPLITTVNDLVAVITYYGLAWLLLINILHIGG